jgi:hypothetical protein
MATCDGLRVEDTSAAPRFFADRFAVEGNPPVPGDLLILSELPQSGPRGPFLPLYTQLIDRAAPMAAWPPAQFSARPGPRLPSPPRPRPWPPRHERGRARGQSQKTPEKPVITAL